MAKATNSLLVRKGPPNKLQSLPKTREEYSMCIFREDSKHTAAVPSTSPPYPDYVHVQGTQTFCSRQQTPPFLLSWSPCSCPKETHFPPSTRAGCAPRARLQTSLLRFLSRNNEQRISCFLRESELYACCILLFPNLNPSSFPHFLFP